LLDNSARQVFDFNETFAALATQNGIENPGRILEASPEDLRLALKSAGEAAYHWNIETDEIAWSTNAAEILGCPLAAVATGKLFANLMDTENFTTRYETVMNSTATDDGRGVPFQIEYMFRSEGRQNAKHLWLEDIGRWQAGLDGTPRSVFGTVRRVDERHQRDQHLNFLGNCDPLTGMMNRGRMTEALGEAISVAKKGNGQCAFAIAAVNNLAMVNEAYGFDVADEVIVAVGRRLRQVMRVGDGIARYSGGKFGIILNDCSLEELDSALRRFLSSIRDNVIETGTGPVWATLSIGAICLPEHAANAIAATSRAEEAMNEARKLPSDGFVVYQPSERRAAERNLNARCATEIVKCLKEDRFKLAFQPIINAKTGAVDLHEALLRMQEQGGELIAASHLIPIAEHLGLVRLVDRTVMQLIIQTLHAYPQAHLSMNVSGTTATDPHWFDQLLDVINANENAAQRLTVEITETVALNDLESTRSFVESLRKAGCNVAIDDFGAGYTSFRNLRELPVNILKFDGSFCRNLGQDKDNEYMVRSLIDLSQKYNLKTIAEWVETEQDAQLLSEWGIDYLQGNILGAASIVPPWGEQRGNVFELEPQASHSANQAPEFTAPTRDEIERPEQAHPEATSTSAQPERFEVEFQPLVAELAQEPDPVFAHPLAPIESSYAVEAPTAETVEITEPQPEQEPLIVDEPKTIAVEASHEMQSEPATAPAGAVADDAFALDFSDLDHSIANLRAALSALSAPQDGTAKEQDAA
jgi:diguanylate cyclase (GGDEF)-like protein